MVVEESGEASSLRDASCFVSDSHDTMSDLYRSAMLNKLPQLPTAAPFASEEDQEDIEEEENDSLGALPSSSMPPPRSWVPAVILNPACSFVQSKE